MSKVVLITGAASGIGRAIASRLVAAGHKVLATDIHRCNIPGSSEHVLDVRSPEQWTAALEGAAKRWAPVDVLINCAGLARAGHYHQLELAEIDRHFDVNLKGAALGMRLVLPQMLARKSGHVINIGSLAAVAPVPGIALYSATKFALRGLSLAVATELAGTGVFVSLVNPDLVDTPMIDAQRHQPEAAISFSGNTPLSADAVAKVVVDEVIPSKRLEVFIPGTRGALAKLLGSFSRIGQLIAPVLRRRGLQQQARERKRRSNS